MPTGWNNSLLVYSRSLVLVPRTYIHVYLMNVRKIIALIKKKVDFVIVVLMFGAP